MNITSNPFALLGNDEGLVAEPEVKNKRKNNNQKGGQGGNNTQQGGGQGGNNNNNANRPVELTAAQRKAKAEKIFKQRNSLSEDQKKQRNKTKKEKKVNKQNPKSPSTPQSKPSTPAAPGATTSTSSTNTTDSKSTSTTTTNQQQPATTPAAPVKTADQLKKEHEEDRQQKISTFLSSVNSALPGSTIFFKLDLTQLQKDSKSIQDDLAAGLWKKSIDRIISTDLFLSKFLSALPPSLGHKTASEVIPVGRYHMKPIRRFDLALHLYSLLKGPSNHGIQHPKEQCLSLVSDFLDGLLDHKPKDPSSSKSKSKGSFDDADADYDAADDEQGKLGSEGNTRSAFNFGDYFAHVKLPESKPKSSEGSSSSSSSLPPDAKGKEKLSDDPSTANQPLQETSFARPSTATAGTATGTGTAAGTAGTGAGVQDKENPTTYLTEEDKNYLDEPTLRSLVRRIPFDYKIGYVCSPLFNPSGIVKPDNNNNNNNKEKRDYSIKERGKDDGAGSGAGAGGERERARKEYEAGFMYSGNGLDHAYVMWRGSDMIWLLTTGLDKTGGKSGQTSGAKVAAVVREDEEKKKKEQQQQQQSSSSGAGEQVGGRPAWKTQRNF